MTVQSIIHYLKFWDVPVPQKFIPNFSNAEEVTQLFHQSNYELFDGYRQAVSCCVGNTLAIPQEKLGTKNSNMRI